MCQRCVRNASIVNAPRFEKRGYSVRSRDSWAKCLCVWNHDWLFTHYVNDSSKRLAVSLISPDIIANRARLYNVINAQIKNKSLIAHKTSTYSWRALFSSFLWNKLWNENSLRAVESARVRAIAPRNVPLVTEKECVRLTMPFVYAVCHSDCPHESSDAFDFSWIIRNSIDRDTRNLQDRWLSRELRW